MAYEKADGDNAVCGCAFAASSRQQSEQASTCAAPLHGNQALQVFKSICIVTMVFFLCLLLLPLL
jgi:hypothetical protein